MGTAVPMRVNHTKLHRCLKWFWIAIIPVSYFLRESVVWVVIISHYAIIVGHWSSEEAADEE
jgi:uncharacterized membrane protein